MVNYPTNITIHLNLFNIEKIMVYDVGNPGPGLRLAQQCGGGKPVNAIPTIYGRIVFIIFILGTSVSKWSMNFYH
jgi:hypothetical protein